jgi:hypothetical protein
MAWKREGRESGLLSFSENELMEEWFAFACDGVVLMSGV